MVKRELEMVSVPNIMSTVTKHYKEGNLNWPMIIYITLAHVAAVVGLFTIPFCHPYTLVWAFLLWPISGMGGITGGAHRLWVSQDISSTCMRYSH